MSNLFRTFSLVSRAANRAKSKVVYEIQNGRLVRRRVPEPVAQGVRRAITTNCFIISYPPGYRRIGSIIVKKSPRDYVQKSKW